LISQGILLQWMLSNRFPDPSPTKAPPMPRLTPAIAILALAGTAAITTGIEPTPKAPQQAQSPEQDAQAITDWIESPLGQSIIESLPADPSFAPYRRLATLIGMPQFREWSQSLSNTKLPHFESYLKHMLEVEHCLDIVRREMSEYTDLNALREAEGIDEDDRFNRQFVFTVMTDLGYLMTLSDQQVAEIEEAGWAIHNETVTGYLDEFTAWAEQNQIRESTAKAMRREFERSYEEMTRIFRNPACAMAYQPYALQFKEEIRAGAEERFSHVARHTLDTALRFSSDNPVQLHGILIERARMIARTAAQMIDLSVQPGPAGVRVIENRAEWNEFSRLTDRYSHFGEHESSGPRTVHFQGYRDGMPLFYAGYTSADSAQQPSIPDAGSPSIAAIEARLRSGAEPFTHPLRTAHSEWFATAAGSAAAAYLPSGYSNPVESLLGDLLELDEFRRVTTAIEADETKRGYLIDYINTVLPRWAWDEAKRPRLVVHTVMTDLLHFESLDAAAIEPILTERGAQIDTLAQIRRDRLHELFAPLDLEDADREHLSRYFDVGMANLDEVARNPAFLASARPLTGDEMIEARAYTIQFWESDLSSLERVVKDLKEFKENRADWAHRMNAESLELRQQWHYSRLLRACRTNVMKAVAETAQAVMKPTVQSPLPEAFHAWRPSRSAEAAMNNIMANDKYSLDVVPVIVPLDF
jgi:hypothetical protein